MFCSDCDRVIMDSKTKMGGNGFAKPNTSGEGDVVVRDSVAFMSLHGQDVRSMWIS